MFVSLNQPNTNTRMYRILKPDEPMCIGDEFRSTDGEWKPIISLIGRTPRKARITVRRFDDSARRDAIYATASSIAAAMTGTLLGLPKTPGTEWTAQELAEHAIGCATALYDAVYNQPKS